MRSEKQIKCDLFKNLVIITHKECWRNEGNEDTFATTGGFPFQMLAIASLFQHVQLFCLLRSSSAPDKLTDLLIENMDVKPLPEPKGSGLIRKLALMPWLLRHLPNLFRAVGRADAVHAIVPGDLGFIGILLSLVRSKPLLVRHCGTWGTSKTIAGRLLIWVLEKYAGDHNIVFATGGAKGPPSKKNPNISWISSTTISEAEWKQIRPAAPWQKGRILRLVTACRLTQGKNVKAIIKALPTIIKGYPKVSLTILGDGPDMSRLRQLTRNLNLQNYVIFKGNRLHEDVIRSFRQSHIFVFPTNVKEGFPKVVIEAMACGLPIIATRVSVIPFLIGRENGRLLESTTSQAVAEAVNKIISNEYKFQLMGISARQTSRAYTLESWRETIQERLIAAWC